MAVYDNTSTQYQAGALASHISRGGLLFANTLFAVRDAIASWNNARVTRIELSKLTDRELDDIGLCRGDIDQVAKKF
ncbi:hypothetical protein TG4357_01184 [Thalassovita gelatinovora]|uniref:YjiS-like domain-containing protein n=1 Tax=Thalassovita gelatinovora TaxID=53501 RepID=A0A0P1FSW1_THAGE|nr:DUF1127 domain-containing protein [Thalassovita gelatinovora]QIZ80344.1 DUF1127 domain-containing protein [Thalassovita gelatinovora]CUH64276.1 hypothetical protein TG4357_01184 [Thalassovita gelatinovora]SEQ94014.1 Uncharacterized conserved protein YjiS, DUF1127 family [Thalassovita gelatinovora]